MEMSVARRKDNWDRTAEIWYLLANANRDEKQQPKPFTRDMVHPLRTAADYRPEQPQHADLDDLKAALAGKVKGL